MDYKFKTVSIKGKQYVEVNERIKYFRESGMYNGWRMISDIHSLTENYCVIIARILDAEGSLIATGIAQEDKGSSFINNTSFIENCETSAWGRALANLGIGVDVSIASYNEVATAISKQQNERKNLTDEIKVKMIDAVNSGEKSKVMIALKNYNATDDQIKEILG